MSYDELLTTATMTSLYCRRLHQVLILLFKCLNGTGPTYIGSLFKYRHTVTVWAKRRGLEFGIT